MKRLAASLAIAAVALAPLTVVAAHRFSDVPDSNIFHDDITWLADADVTRGCDPPDNTRYCPEDQVTREQMAAFMHRLAENRVVDAGRLEGRTVADLTAELGGSPVALAYQSADSVPFLDGEFTAFTVTSVTVQAPPDEPAAALAEAVGNVLGTAGETVDENRDFACWIATQPDDLSSDSGALVQYRPGQPTLNQVFATSHALEIPAGSEVTFYLRCRDISAGSGDGFRVSGARLSALVIPGGLLLSRSD